VSRYAQMFERLDGQGAFIPFCVLGDPTPAASLGYLEAMARGGADALELGIPFSDPVADGPTIQAADVRALEAGTTPAIALDVIKQFRQTDDTTPIGLLVYANLVVARGRDDFYRRAQAAGVDSILVADVPTVEATPFLESASAAGIEPVMIATPNASDEHLAAIASASRGYTYVVTRVGVTGTETEAGGGQDALLSKLAALGAPPCVLGFGISSPEHVRSALQAGAAGAISGSAVVRIIERHRADAKEAAAALEEFVRGMKAATLE
jgi:tryptophan synthase alpha chain